MQFSMNLSLVATLCVLFIGGCTGSAGTASDDPDEPSGGQGGNVGGGEGGRGAGGETLRRFTDCGPVTVPELWRLSRDEYRNAMDDLFPNHGVALAFPRDASIFQFENEAQALHANALLVQQLEANAWALAVVATKDVATFTGCGRTEAATELACAKSFIATFGRRVARRPLSSDQAARAERIYANARTAVDHAAGISAVIAAWLQSPEFLYRVARGPNATDYDRAERLAFALWQAPPNAQLLADAADGKFAGGQKEIKTTLEGLRKDARFARSVVAVHRQWLELERIVDSNWSDKDTKLFPAWTPGIAESALDESNAFLADVIAARGGGLKELLTSNIGSVDARMARLYGLPAAGTSLTLPARERPGILSRAAFLASHAHRQNGSPPLRGAAILRRLLCTELGDPPPTADISNPADDADASTLTNREVFERRVAPSDCSHCHKIMDGLAYPLEAYDAAGAYRTTDHGKPVNTSTTLRGTDVDGDYADLPQMAAALAESNLVQACVSQQMLSYTVGRKVSDEADAESCLIHAGADFLASGGSLPGLLNAFAEATTGVMQ